MTEVYEDGWLVRVRAQVMSRDEATGGWVALGGGGLSHVRVGKRRRAKTTPATGDSSEDSSRSSHAHTHGYEYYICGARISDDTEVLSCTIKKDFQYNKVMPTFHHWVTDEKRFGLTFQTAADARAFDRGVRTAVEELLDGLGGAWPSLHAYKKHNPAPREDDEENNIFECLNLPTDSRSSSENSTASRPHRRSEDISQTPILSAITLPSQQSPHCAETSLKQFGVSMLEESSGVDESSPYVQLTAVHEYTYPQVGPCGVISSESSPDTKPPLMRRGSGSFKKGVCGSYGGPPPLPDKKPGKPSETFQSRLKCRHCHEWYLESANRAGACQFAPDCCKSCVDAASCIKCAQCMLYHCMSDAEGDFALHPCACGPPSDACAKRWLGIALLSILVPCLCCYAPLRCAHRAAKAAHVAGGHHAPVLH